MAAHDLVFRPEARLRMRRVEESLRESGHLSAAYGVRLAIDALDESSEFAEPIRAALMEGPTVSVLSDARQTSICLPTTTLNAARAAVGLEPL